MPVFDLGRNVYNIAGDEQLRGLARFLIVASSCHADKNLPAAGFRVVDVPVVAAAGLKGNVAKNRPVLGSVSGFRNDWPMKNLA